MKISRLQELERRAFGHTITLTMPDGSTERLPAVRLEAAVRDATQHTTSPDLQLILGSVADDGALCGQGHLVDLIRVMAHARSGAPVGADYLDSCEGADGVSPEAMNEKELIH